MGAVTTDNGVDRADRVPKQDRSRATRQRLLEAAVACLAEHGWAGSTVAVVAERAGVSRGAAQHHFPTRDDLFTAALEHVTHVRAEELRRELEGLPGARPSTTAEIGRAACRGRGGGGVVGGGMGRGGSGW